MQLIAFNIVTKLIYVNHLLFITIFLNSFVIAEIFISHRNKNST